MAPFRWIQEEADRHSKIRVVTALRAIYRWYNQLPFPQLERLRAREGVPFPTDEMERTADRTNEIAYGHFSAQREAMHLLEQVRRWYRTLPDDLLKELEYWGYGFPAEDLEGARAALSYWD